MNASKSPAQRWLWGHAAAVEPLHSLQCCLARFSEKIFHLLQFDLFEFSHEKRTFCLCASSNVLHVLCSLLVLFFTILSSLERICFHAQPWAQVWSFDLFNLIMLKVERTFFTNWKFASLFILTKENWINSIYNKYSLTLFLQIFVKHVIFSLCFRGVVTAKCVKWVTVSFWTLKSFMSFSGSVCVHCVRVKAGMPQAVAYVSLWLRSEWIQISLVT